MTPPSDLPSNESRPSKTLRIAVAGATGFVGQKLVPALAERHAVVALGRRVSEEPEAALGDARPGIYRRRCDLFSLRETEQALAGVDIAYYLVHSMMPSSRLTQARFEDLDLLLADNFGRAASRAGVKRIVYLGGLVPEGETDLSAHLASRLEVERALAAYGVSVTAVRAGLVVGGGGSSLQILVRLVGRLPAMICPRWTGELSQPIALADVVTILVHCAEDEETSGRVCEVGGPDILSYRDMMRATARALGKKRVMIPVPLFTPGLSRLWVTLVTQQPRELVAPLIQSLQHPMVARDPWLQRKMGLPGTPLDESLSQAVQQEGLRQTPTARSVQRVRLPEGRDASWLAHEYAAWLPRALWTLVRVEREERDTGERLRFHLRGVRQALLELTLREERSWPDRALYEVTGGLLAGPPIGLPRLEFRIAPGRSHAIAAVQDFHPRLPWWLYAQTQARLHLWVMWRFGRHLSRVARGEAVALVGNPAVEP